MHDTSCEVQLAYRWAAERRSVCLRHIGRSICWDYSRAAYRQCSAMYKGLQREIKRLRKRHLAVGSFQIKMTQQKWKYGKRFRLCLRNVRSTLVSVNTEATELVFGRRLRQV